MPWWFFVAGAAADLTIGAGVVAIEGGRGSTDERQADLAGPSRDILLCEECAKQARRGSGLLLNWFGLVPHS